MAMKARIAMAMNKGGKIISYQCRQTGWVRDIAHTKSITRKKTACLRFQKNISSPFDSNLKEIPGTSATEQSQPTASREPQLTQNDEPGTEYLPQSEHNFAGADVFGGSGSFKAQL